MLQQSRVKPHRRGLPLEIVPEYLVAGSGEEFAGGSLSNTGQQHQHCTISNKGVDIPNRAIFIDSEMF